MVEGTSIQLILNHASGGSLKAFVNIFCSYFWTGGFVTGSADTYNNFQPSANGDGRYLLTKKLQANHSPGTSGGGSTSNGEDFGGGY